MGQPQYDDDNLLVEAGNLTLTRDPQNGLLNGSTLGSVSDTWSYNLFGKPTAYAASFSGTEVYSVQLTRDRLGRIVGKTETVEGVTTTCNYTYDLAGQLAEAKENGVIVSTYTYDANSNRLSLTTPSGTITASYDDQDRLNQYGSTSYTYTANGELLSRNEGIQTTTYDYDVLGNLLSLDLPDGTQIEYLIDARNRRIGKKVNGTLVQAFLYEDQLNPITELDSGGNVTARFVYASRANVPDYLIKGGNTYRIIADHLGSPRLVVDAVTGQIAQRLEYDEFGRIVPDTNPGFQPFGFAGGLYDPDTELVRFGARDYEAETGRWTAKDPIGFNRRLLDGLGADPITLSSTEANLYLYIRNNPINFVDPTGEGIFAAAVVGGVCVVLGIGGLMDFSELVHCQHCFY